MIDTLIEYHLRLLLSVLLILTYVERHNGGLHLTEDLSMVMMVVWMRVVTEMSAHSRTAKIQVVLMQRQLLVMMMVMVVVMMLLLLRIVRLLL